MARKSPTRRGNGVMVGDGESVAREPQKRRRLPPGTFVLTFLAVLCASMVLSWPVERWLREWKHYGEYSITDDKGRQYTVTVLVKEPMVIPGDLATLRLVGVANGRKIRKTLRPRWRWGVGEVQASGDTLTVFPFLPTGIPWETVPRKYFRIVDGKWIVTDIEGVIAGQKH